MIFEKDKESLAFYFNGERVRIEPWGRDSLRVRATMLPRFSGKDWALTEAPAPCETQIAIEEFDNRLEDGATEKQARASLTNGRIRCDVNHKGVLSFYKDGALILREYYRAYDGTISRESRCLKITGREWKGVIGGSEHQLRLKFESNKGEKMHDYIKSLFDEAHENGSPLLRAMFYEFPEDARCWELQDQYMFGGKYLVAPILRLDQFKREVYLPAGPWKLTSTGEVYEGGCTVTVDAPLEYMPVFERV